VRDNGDKEQGQPVAALLGGDPSAARRSQQRSTEKLVLLHLSDIHFRSHDNGDPDEDLRNELERDAVRVINRIGHVDGVLVTGDIAFSGKAREYDMAAEWLDRLCALIGCPIEDVWVIPGNHDVNRDAIGRDQLIPLVHKDVRPDVSVDAPRDISRHIDAHLNALLGTEAGDKFFASIEQFNRFALRFGCQSTRTQLVWEDDLPLNDGSTLRLRGINSTLVSGPHDNLGTNKLVVGGRQSLPPSHDGVAYLTLCHHPPRWLCDEDQVNDHLGNRVTIQLFGHRHRQRADKINESLRLAAGAVHPGRDEPEWEPRYNVLSIDVLVNNDGRFLRVVIWPRVYRAASFLPDNTYTAPGGESQTYLLRLAKWDGPPFSSPNTDPPQEATPMVMSPTTSAGALAPSQRKRATNAERRLVFRFFGLGYADIMTIAAKLYLFSNEDEGVNDTERFQRYYHRAKSRDLLPTLWEEVERRYSDGNTEANPFAQTKPVA